jgi:hypothetical protein
MPQPIAKIGTSEVREHNDIIRQTLKQKDGSTHMPEADSKTYTREKVKGYDPGKYVRVSNNLFRGRNDLRNADRNITTVQGARTLMMSEEKTQEDRLIEAMNEEREHSEKFDKRYFQDQLKPTIESRDTQKDLFKPMITTYINPDGEEIPNGLHSLLNSLGKGHLIAEMHPATKRGVVKLTMGLQGF